MPFLPYVRALAAILAAVVTAAGCAPAISGLTIEAVRTEARVKTALVNDPVVGGRVINVRMVGSVAELSGRVASAEEAARATAIARAVTGVSEVQSRLVVGDSPDSLDAELETIALARSWGRQNQRYPTLAARSLDGLSALAQLATASTRFGGFLRVRDEA